MAAWGDAPFVGVDFETTGVDIESDRIVTATIVHDVPGAELQIHNWLVDPGVDIPVAASDIHHVTTDVAREQGTPADEAIPDIYRTLMEYWSSTVPVVAFNAPYDLNILDRESHRRGGPSVFAPMPGAVVDPLVIDRGVFPYRKGSRTLATLCELHGVELVNAHTSDADVVATMALARLQSARYAGIREWTLAELFRYQRQTYESWAHTYANFLVRGMAALSEGGRVEARDRVTRLRAGARTWPKIHLVS